MVSLKSRWYQMKQINGKSLLALIALTLMANGCSQSSEWSPRADNKNIVNAQGQFVGHLKPDERDVNALANVDMHDLVQWVVDGNEIRQPRPPLSVHHFRLDFDQSQSITEQVLPYSLMTKDSRQVVIHRGPPPADFSHPEIADGQQCLPVFVCFNPDCPRSVEIENAALFPHDSTTGKPKCPFCGGDQAAQYQSPQHDDMRQYLKPPDASDNAVKHED